MTNPIWNRFQHVNEQQLYDRLINENISIGGMEMYFMPRKRVAYDKVYSEDGQSIFDSAYIVDVLMKSSSGFLGQGTFMSPVGMFEVRDRFIFSIAKTEFANEVTTKRPTAIRPFEGDWLYFPLNQRIFEIQFVDNKPVFYQAGELQVYNLTCELIEYTNERIETGIDEIDAVQKRNSTNLYDYALKDEANNVLLDTNGDVIIDEKYDDNQKLYDPTRDNSNIRNEANTDGLFVFTEKNPLANNSTY